MDDSFASELSAPSSPEVFRFQNDGQQQRFTRCRQSMLVDIPSGSDDEDEVVCRQPNVRKEPSMENNPDHSHDYLSSGEEILPGDEYYANNIQNECFELQDATNEIQMLSDTESGSSTFGISECSSHETDFSENEILANENVDELLYENSNITVLSFSHLLLLFSVKHNLSGEATKNLLKLFATVLPENNKCPLTMSKLKKISKQFQHRKTHYQVCQHCHSQLDKQLHCFNEVCRESHPIQDALSFYILDIESQLRSIVTENHSHIVDYKSKKSIDGSYNDIVDGSCYQNKIYDHCYVTLVWFIDGAPPIRSKNVQMWPITAFVVELPIALRYALKNIVFCGLWYGNKKPEFDFFQLHFVQAVKHLRENGFNVMVNNQNISFNLKIQAGLADLPARAASLNLKQFNGKFGCPVCYHPGQKLCRDSLVWIYPYQDENERAVKRTHDELELHGNAAEQNNTIFFGVKGRSVLLDIMNLPDEIPFDYMHLVVEGEFRRKLLNYILPRNGFLYKDALSIINSSLTKMKYPHDFSKKTCTINESTIKRAKAGELQLLLLHVILPLLKGSIPDKIFCHLGLFVTAIQILNEDTVTDQDVDLAGKMLEEYHKLNCELYGPGSQTFTNHALLHLAEQRKVHGCPLVLLSNFVFEGFIGTLKRQFHGTRGIIDQMVTNISTLQNAHLIAKNIGGDYNMQHLTATLCGNIGPDKIKIDTHTYMYGCTTHVFPTIPDYDLPEELDNQFPPFTQYCQRILHNGAVYHSLSYVYKRNSNSYMVAYLSNNEINFGKILFFAKTATGCSVVLRVLHATGRSLFPNNMLGSLNDTVDDFIETKVLGKCFYHVIQTDDIVIISHRQLHSRIIFVPVSNDDDGYVSLVLNSYQHD